jgi:DNA-binding GntR family transcriptional regulator
MTVSPVPGESAARPPSDAMTQPVRFDEASEARKSAISACPPRDDLRRDVERHQPIIDALRQRDGEAAVAALEEHLRAVIDTVTRAKASEMAAATR